MCNSTFRTGILILSAVLLAAPPARAAGLLSSEYLVREGGQPSATVGAAVSTAGDVNGDGYSDLLVGSGLVSGTFWCYLSLGTSVPPLTMLGSVVATDQAGSSFGQSLATAGDVNGDGFDDVVIGASGYANGEPGEGRAYISISAPRPASS
jgi:hypothetical protein